MKREFRGIVGDWGGDGHSQTKELFFTAEGEDVSNETLTKNYNETVEEVGFGLSDLCSKYEESVIKAEEMNRLIECGYADWRLSKEEEKIINPFLFTINVWEEVDLNGEEISEIYLMELLSFFFKAKIREYKLDLPYLFGNDKNLMNNDSYGFGYGLFY